MKKHHKKGIIIVSVLIFLVISAISYHYLKPKQVVGNQEILKEINALLKPLEDKNITEADFAKLEALTKKDNYAHSQVEELQILSRYNEYTHIGHGLGFVYYYVKTGKPRICPGHALAHYYVFTRHNEKAEARYSLQEAQVALPFWQKGMQEHPELEQDYNGYNQAFTKTIQSILSGQTGTTDDQIELLSNSPCIG